MNMHDITFRGLTAHQLGRVIDAAFGALGSECPDPEIEARRQDKFDVTLTSVGANKIHIIKAIREITGLGLKEAKDLVEAAPPQMVAKQVTQPQMKAAVAALREAGATVEVS